MLVMKWFERESDIEILRSKASLVQRENDVLHRKLVELKERLQTLEGSAASSLQQELDLLAEQLRAQRHREFAQSSERRGQVKPDKERAPQTGHGPTEQPNLPIEELEHPIEKLDDCPLCGETVELWTGQTEDSEEVTVIERKFVVHKHKRHKARCKCGGHVQTAPGPNRLISGGRYSMAFALAVALDKYLKHMPLARQERSMADRGLVVTRQTLWDQLFALSRLFVATYDALREHVLDADVIGADETTWRMLTGKKKWWVWAVGQPDGIHYTIASSRSHKVAGQVMGKFAGIAMVDGYVAYGTLQRARKGKGLATFTLVACWAHVRRKYVHCEADYPEATEVIGLIGELFRIDREVAETDWPSDAARLEELGRRRATESKAVLAKIRTWRKEVRAVPRSSLDRAVNYMDDLWTRLVVFAGDARVPLTNNLLDRGMRRPAIGRKNHYGSKSLRGTQVAAVMYSLIETCKLLGVSSEQYLTTLAERALVNGEDFVLLPHEFKAELAAQV